MTRSKTSDIYKSISLGVRYAIATKNRRLLDLIIIDFFCGSHANSSINNKYIIINMLISSFLKEIGTSGICIIPFLENLFQEIIGDEEPELQEEKNDFTMIEYIVENKSQYNDQDLGNRYSKFIYNCNYVALAKLLYVSYLMTECEQSYDLIFFRIISKKELSNKGPFNPFIQNLTNKILNTIKFKEYNDYKLLLNLCISKSIDTFTFLNLLYSNSKYIISSSKASISFVNFLNDIECIAIELAKRLYDSSMQVENYINSIFGFIYRLLRKYKKISILTNHIIRIKKKYTYGINLIFHMLMYGSNNEFICKSFNYNIDDEFLAGIKSRKLLYSTNKRLQEESVKYNPFKNKNVYHVRPDLMVIQDFMFSESRYQDIKLFIFYLVKDNNIKDFNFMKYNISNKEQWIKENSKRYDVLNKYYTNKIGDNMYFTQSTYKEFFEEMKIKSNSVNKITMIKNFNFYNKFINSDTKKIIRYCVFQENLRDFSGYNHIKPISYDVIMNNEKDILITYVTKMTISNNFFFSMNSTYNHSMNKLLSTKNGINYQVISLPYFVRMMTHKKSYHEYINFYLNNFHNIFFYYSFKEDIYYVYNNTIPPLTGRYEIQDNDNYSLSEVSFMATETNDNSQLLYIDENQKCYIHFPRCMCPSCIGLTRRQMFENLLK